MTINKIYVAILCETWLDDNTCSSMARYNFIFKNREDIFGGVGIYLHKNIRYAIRHMGSAQDTLAISTINLKQHFNIISNYSPPSMNINDFNEEMMNIFTIAERSPNPTLICGNFNAKVVLWNPNGSNHKGRILEQLAMD